MKEQTQTAVWKEMQTEPSGKSVFELAENQPILLVFLRHFGCSFCREAISDIARQRKNLEANGIRTVFVHMASDYPIAEKFFKKYKLFPVDNIADPDCKFYRAFGLGKGTPKQLFGLMNWMRGFQAGVMEGHGFAYHSLDIGDGFQMPGVFVLHKGEIKNSFIHRHAHDRPDYQAICNF